MKKVVQINVCNYGSTGNIMKKIHNMGTKENLEMYFFYGRGKKSEIPNTKKIGNKVDFIFHFLLSRVFDLHGFGSYFSTKRLIKELDKIQPDVVHLHNIHGYYINIKLLFNYLCNSGIKVVWTLHDCWAFTGHCSYFDACNCQKWKKECFKCPQSKNYPKSMFFDRSKKNFLLKKELFNSLKKENLTIVTPSAWLKNLVDKSFLSKYNSIVINNDIDLDVFKPTESDFRKRYNLLDKKIILGVANVWTENKGINTFLNLSKKLDDNYKIVLVGLSEKQITNLPKNIIGIGKTRNKKELAEIYSAADVFFNPTKEDNYPTVNLEAQACGTPVITYDRGGCKETLFTKNSIAIKEDYEDIKTLIDKVCSSPCSGEKFDLINFQEYINLYKNSEKEKNVLFVSNTPSPYRIDFFNELGKYVDLKVIFEKKMSSERDDSWNNINVENFKLSFLNGISISADKSISLSIIKTIRKNKYRKIIIGNPLTPTGIIAIFYMKFKRIPYSIEIDGGFARNTSSLKRKIKRIILKGAEKYFSTSNEGDKYLIYFGADPKRIVRYPFSSIRKDDIIKKITNKKEKQKIKKELKIKEERVILSVGRFIYSKGYDLLIKSSKSVGENVGIYIVGGKPTKEYIDLKRKYNAKNVHFVDFKLKEDLKKYYMCADLFVFPTRSDVWGLVINEAMAHGLPIITTDMCIAGLELIENGENGYIVHTDDLEELKIRINELINNDKLLENISKNNLEKIKKYTVEEMAISHVERV